MADSILIIRPGASSDCTGAAEGESAKEVPPTALLFHGFLTVKCGFGESKTAAGPGAGPTDGYPLIRVRTAQQKAAGSSRFTPAGPVSGTRGSCRSAMGNHLQVGPMSVVRTFSGARPAGIEAWMARMTARPDRRQVDDDVSRSDHPDSRDITVSAANTVVRFLNHMRSVRMTLKITNTVSRFFAGVDRCDWDTVRALMTDPFHVDYSSYTGEEPGDVSPADLIGVWAGFLPYLDSVHHQIGNLIVVPDGDSATVQCHGTATHFIAGHPDGDLRFVVGTYDFTLVRTDECWRISGMRFNFKYASGNADLAVEAQRRASEQTQEK